MTDQQPKEFRLSGGSTILGYIQRFSATEKAMFTVLTIATAVSAFAMAVRVNSHFTIEVPAYKGALHEGLVGLPHTVNPVLALTDVDKDIASLVYAGLTRYEDGIMAPDLAASWSTSTDGLSYTFTLREGLSFQDGRPLTADDVVFTIHKIQDPALKSPRAADWIGITATTTSPLSVRFTLRQPYSAFLANTSIGIIPKHIWDKVSDDQFLFSEYNIQPVGAGPYRVGKVSRDQGGIPTTYELSAWHGYHGERPHIQKIVFSFFADESHAISALESGIIDSLPTVSPIEANRLSSNAGEPYIVVSTPFTRIFGVFFNQNNNAILTELAVRRALDMAVDREVIIETAIQGYGTPIHDPLPPGASSREMPLQASSTSVATPASSTSPWQADIAGAQAILEKAGWKQGNDGIYTKTPAKATTKTLALTLYTADAPELKQAAELVKQAWTALGARVDLKVFEPSDLYQNVIRTRSYDALLFGEAIGKDNDLYAFWHSSQRNAPGLNVAMYVNSKADKILENIRDTADPAERATLFSDFRRAVNADVPAVFLYAPDFIYLMPKTLRGMDMTALSASSDRWDDSAGWYVETERIWSLFSSEFFR